MQQMWATLQHHGPNHLGAVVQWLPHLTVRPCPHLSAPRPRMVELCKGIAPVEVLHRPGDVLFYVRHTLRV